MIHIIHELIYSSTIQIVYRAPEKKGNRVLSNAEEKIMKSLLLLFGVLAKILRELLTTPQRPAPFIRASPMANSVNSALRICQLQKAMFTQLLDCTTACTLDNNYCGAGVPQLFYGCQWGYRSQNLNCVCSNGFCGTDVSKGITFDDSTGCSIYQGKSSCAPETSFNELS